MWGNKNVEPESTVPETPNSSVARSANPTPPMSASLENTGTARSGNRLGQGLFLKGEISGHEDLQVDGKVEGVIRLDTGKLIVGASAKLICDIVANEIVVYGTVTGNLQGRHRIEIRKQGSVVGDLTTARIMIEDGASFKGAIEIAKTPVESTVTDQKAAFVPALRAEAAKVA